MLHSLQIKPVFYWLFLWVITFFLVACGSDKSLSENKQNIRLIALSPHLSELVASAGAVDNLVGVVAYSDFPEQVKNIQQVGDAFKIDYETIISLKPDYILTWKDGTPQVIVEKLKSLNLNVVETKINTLADIPQVIYQIAQLAHTISIANNNIKQFNQSLQKFENNKHKTQSIFIETYNQPLYTVSGKHWMSEAAAICGYQNIFDDLSQLSGSVSLEAVISKNPQSILNISQQQDPQWQKWQSLNATKNNKIYTISPDFFSRPSLRIIIGIEQLCAF